MSPSDDAPRPWLECRQSKVRTSLRSGGRLETRGLHLAPRELLQLLLEALDDETDMLGDHCPCGCPDSKPETIGWI